MIIRYTNYSANLNLTVKFSQGNGKSRLQTGNSYSGMHNSSEDHSHSTISVKSHGANLNLVSPNLTVKFSQGNGKSRLQTGNGYSGVYNFSEDQSHSTSVKSHGTNNVLSPDSTELTSETHNVIQIADAAASNRYIIIVNSGIIDTILIIIFYLVQVKPMLNLDTSVSYQKLMSPIRY